MSGDWTPAFRMMASSTKFSMVRSPMVTPWTLPSQMPNGMVPLMPLPDPQMAEPL